MTNDMYTHCLASEERIEMQLSDLDDMVSEMHEWSTIVHTLRSVDQYLSELDLM